ncbi:hypothetical protein H5410_019206 [Solanum commersonii]|uniref:Uncharacterized protein n=1 Tax=Solanum commersonii TaxID=4109 RepID=A0A9J6A433_SOLCO|nr:hypothetical protein H5410_019206 [Solanum commersonii]
MHVQVRRCHRPSVLIRRCESGVRHQISQPINEQTISDCGRKKQFSIEELRSGILESQQQHCAISDEFQLTNHRSLIV